MSAFDPGFSAGFGAPAAGLGWPTDEELAAELGLPDGVETARIASANAAARADAGYARADLEPAGPADWGQYKAVLGLGVWWYEVRNRPEGLDSLNPVASPYARRVMLGVLIRGRLAIA